MFSMVNLVGYAGMFTGVSFMLPQLYRMYKTKSVEDIAWGMLILFALNSVAWFTYGALLHAVPLMWVNGLGFVVTVAQIVLKYLYRNNP